MGTQRPRRRLLGAATFPRTACAGSWCFPTLPQHVLGASGRNRQAASPSFLMQFANGCEDRAKPERDWEPEPLRLPRCRRDACCREVVQRCGAGEPAGPGLAHSALRCQSPRQISLRILTGENKAAGILGGPPVYVVAGAGPRRFLLGTGAQAGCVGAGYNNPFRFHHSNTQMLGANHSSACPV